MQALSVLILPDFLERRSTRATELRFGGASVGAVGRSPPGSRHSLEHLLLLALSRYRSRRFEHSLSSAEVVRPQGMIVHVDIGCPAQ